LPVTGAWLLACRTYLAGRQGEDTDYLVFLGDIAGKMALIGSVLAVALLVGWMLTLPAAMSTFALSIWPIAAGLAVLALEVLGMNRSPLPSRGTLLCCT
jgi:hypothetical protein